MWNNWPLSDAELWRHSISRYILKLFIDPLADFSGEAVDYEDWARKVGATIKQTAYKDFLSRSATVGDAIEEAMRKELFNMLLSCVSGGYALNTIECSLRTMVVLSVFIMHGKHWRTGMLILPKLTVSFIIGKISYEYFSKVKFWWWSNTLYINEI